MNDNIRIEAQTAGVFNFAMQQNYIPLIRSINIINNDGVSYENIIVKVSFDPEIAKPFEYNILLAESGRTTEISPIKLTISSEMLFLTISVRMCMY